MISSDCHTNMFLLRVEDRLASLTKKVERLEKERLLEKNEEPKRETQDREITKDHIYGNEFCKLYPFIHKTTLHLLIDRYKDIFKEEFDIIMLGKKKFFKRNIIFMLFELEIIQNERQLKQYRVFKKHAPIIENVLSESSYITDLNKFKMEYGYGN